jgi:ADP-heptose:LPS heptosyltransferase
MVNKILISRTDGIGDVILTLPLAGYIKKYFPYCKVGFLCSEYTAPIVCKSENIDDVLNWTEIKKKSQDEQIRAIGSYEAILHVFPDKCIADIAKKANVLVRIGTSHRWYHIFTCNQRVGFSRSASPYHESQLNFRLLRPFGINRLPDLEKMADWYGLKVERRKKVEEVLDTDKISIALHPKSKGSGREWGIDNFCKLIELLDPSKYKIFLTGVQSEKEILSTILVKYSHVHDLVGVLTLDEFIEFLSGVDCLVAASTGPLHVASALGRYTIGLYPPIRPLHPGRWAPVGYNASFLVNKKKKCSLCKKNNVCQCMQSISPKDVADRIESFLIKKAHN